MTTAECHGMLMRECRLCGFPEHKLDDWPLPEPREPNCPEGGRLATPNPEPPLMQCERYPEQNCPSLWRLRTAYTGKCGWNCESRRA